MGSLESLGIPQGVPPVLPPSVEEVLPVGNDVVEGVRRDVSKVHGLKVKTLRDELLIQLGQMDGIPEDAGVESDHDNRGTSDHDLRGTFGGVMGAASTGGLFSVG